MLIGRDAPRKSRGPYFWSTMAAAAFFAAAAAPQDPVATPFETMGETELVDIYNKQFSLYKSDSPDVDYCGALLPVSLELYKRRPDLKERLDRQIPWFDLQCALKEERFGDAYGQIKKIEDARGSSAGLYGADIAMKAGAYEDGVARVEEAIAQPEGLSKLSIDILGYFMRKLDSADQVALGDRLLNSVHASPQFAAFNPFSRDDVIRLIVTRAVKAKQYKRAATLLPDITSHSSFAYWLSNRSFEPLWTQIEHLAGPGMTKIREREATIYTAYSEAHPTDREAFSVCRAFAAFCGPL